jgi:type I restriction enzyme R subunit
MAAGLPGQREDHPDHPDHLAEALTGVDARNVRNIVLLRPVNSMIEFKQIIGRGTRLYDGKDYFTIYDFVKAHHHFSDPEWDGEPLSRRFANLPSLAEPPPKTLPCLPAINPVRARGSRARMRHRKTEEGQGEAGRRQGAHIQHMMMRPASGTRTARRCRRQQFMERCLASCRSSSRTRTNCGAVERAGHPAQAAGRAGRERLRQGSAAEMQKIIDAENSDLFDVLAHVAYACRR